MGLGKADLPRRAGVLDRSERRGAGAAFVAGDGDVVGARLGDAGGDGADADFGDELYGDVAVGVDVLQVEDQLRQVFDRINIVVRRRRNQADARRRMAHLGDGLVDFVAGQLAAFAGLGALGDLDLHHVRVDQVFGGDAEAARRHLLDRGAHRIAVRQRLEAVGFLAALAGIGLAADAIHGDGERGMRLARDRAERHGAGREPTHDGPRRLDLLDRHRLARVLVGRLDAEQAADGVKVLRLVVDDAGELPVFFERIAAHRVLQRRHRRRIPDVLLATDAEGIFAADVEHGAVDWRVGKRVAMPPHRFLGDFGKADALDAGGGAGEIFGDELGLQSDRVENLR